ncbi:MAG TPA: hypothetical protein PKL65_08570 [Bacteroidales bacterium]|nr:hypothetical protein [Bacteroidales bacterium]HNR42271.1 hypothetical protein [Bacteroidales bacterium]HPM17449.1 hypothetical protein [Bacteroidales bacterium]
MKRAVYSLIAAAAIILANGCSKEYELNKSIFIPDPDFPELPAYTEWGYNTFGAYYERGLFLYSENAIPAKIIRAGGITSFVLKGQKDGYGYHSWDNRKEMSVTFLLPSVMPDSYADLTILDKKIIDLVNTPGAVKLFLDGDTIKPDILQGELEFRRVQLLYVDSKQTEVILSGVFSFQALIKDEPVSVTQGRFDVGIGEDNFFSY